MTEREKILRDTIKTITQDRQDQYGRPENNFQKIADMWNAYIHSYSGATEQIELTPKDVAVMQILLKIARMSTGKEKRDNYVDICGYVAIAYELVAESGVKVCDAEEAAGENDYLPRGNAYDQ